MRAGGRNASSLRVCTSAVWLMSGYTWGQHLGGGRLDVSSLAKAAADSCQMCALLPPPALLNSHTLCACMQVGTMAYVDPEYMRTGQYSPKSDVYALGEGGSCACIMSCLAWLVVGAGSSRVEVLLLTGLCWWSEGCRRGRSHASMHPKCMLCPLLRAGIMVLHLALKILFAFTWPIACKHEPILCLHRCTGIVMLQLLTGQEGSKVVSLVEGARADVMRFGAVRVFFGRGWMHGWFLGRERKAPVSACSDRGAFFTWPLLLESTCAQHHLHLNAHWF